MKDSALFCNKLHTSYAAGIPIKRALSLIAGERRRTNPAARIAGDLADCLERDATLWQAAHWMRRRLPPFFVALVEVGEKTGTLDKALATLTRYYEDCADLNRRLWRELMYPICLVLAIGIGIPILKVFLMGVAGQSFAYPTGLLHFLDTWLGIRIAPIFLAIAGIILAGLEPFILLGIAVAIVSRIPGLWAFLLTLCLWTPIAGRFFRRFAVSRFARAMELMESAGYPPHHAVWVSARAAQVPSIALDFARRAEYMRKGMPYSKAFADSPYLTAEHKAYLQTGDETGTSDQSFACIARDEHDKAVTALRGLIPCLGGLMIVYIAFGYFTGQGSFAYMVYRQLKRLVSDRILEVLGVPGILLSLWK